MVGSMTEMAAFAVHCGAGPACANRLNNFRPGAAMTQSTIRHMGAEYHIKRIGEMTARAVGRCAQILMDRRTIMWSMTVLTIHRDTGLTVIDCIDDRLACTGMAYCTIGLVGGQDCIEVDCGVAGRAVR